MSTPPTPSRRRTQAERRADTEARLIAATIESLSENGYSRTTTNEICRRAGVSQGGLFARFGTLRGLLLAAGATIGRTQVANFREGFEKLADPNDIAALLTLLQANTRNDYHAAWIELIVASRTDDELRDGISSVLTEHGEEIFQFGQRVAILEAIPEPSRRIVLLIILYYFDGDALFAKLAPRPEMDRNFIDELASIFSTYANSQA